MLLDTNVVIYSCQTDGGWLTQWTGHADAAIASVTRVEALGFVEISPAEESAIREYLGRCMAYPLDEEVIERAIPSAPAKADEARRCDHRGDRPGIWPAAGDSECR